MEWHRKKPGMASQKNKSEQQARRTSQKNKKDQKEQSTSKFKYN